MLDDFKVGKGPKLLQFHFDRMVSNGVEEINAAKMITATNILLNDLARRGMAMSVYEISMAYNKLPNNSAIKLVEESAANDYDAMPT